MNKLYVTRPSVYLRDRVMMIKYQNDFLKALLRRFFNAVDKGEPVHVNLINRIIQAAEDFQEQTNMLKDRMEIELNEK